jgi:hypothetical protein
MGTMSYLVSQLPVSPTGDYPPVQEISAVIISDATSASRAVQKAAENGFIKIGVASAFDLTGVTVEQFNVTIESAATPVDPTK